MLYSSKWSELELDKHRWNSLRRKVSVMLFMLFLLIHACMSVFNPQPVEASGTIHINVDGSVSPPNAPIFSEDNVTYILTSDIYDSIVVERNHIIIDGLGHKLHGDNVGTGISLFSITNVTIKNLRIVRFANAIEARYSTFISVLKSNIAYNYRGVYIYSSTYINVSGSYITNNRAEGILLEGCTAAGVAKNTITCNGWGVRAKKSNTIRVYVNNITENSEGICYEHCSGSSIVENIIATNTIGIHFIDSSNFIIYSNNFINNDTQASIGADCQNSWNQSYPAGGNFWSDYTGVDEMQGPNQNETGSDGIGDTPYVINANNTDYYPLMNPYAVHPLPTHSLTVITATAGGTTNPAPGNYTYVSGAVVSVTATPDLGYSFHCWLLDGTIKTENPIDILMYTDHTLEAFFIDDIPPEISDPVQNPSEDVQPFQNVTVTVTVTDYGTGVQNVTLLYSLDNGTTWTPLNMIEVSPNTYQTTIPGYENCTWVTYKIVAYDNAGNNATKDNFGFNYKYHVIPENSFILLLLLTLITVATFMVSSKSEPV